MIRQSFRCENVILPNRRTNVVVGLYRQGMHVQPEADCLIEREYTQLEERISSIAFHNEVDCLNFPLHNASPMRFVVGELNADGYMREIDCEIRRESEPYELLTAPRGKRIRKRLQEGARIELRGKYRVLATGKIVLCVDFIRPIDVENRALQRRRLSFEMAAASQNSRKLPHQISTSYRTHFGKVPYNRIDQRYSKILLLAPQRSRAFTDFSRKYKLSEQVELVKVSMSGSRAVSDICQKIAIADNQCKDGNSLLVICRGGGAVSDLAVFDSPKIVKAIAEAKNDVATAIGHYGDFHAADLAARYSSATPSGMATDLNAVLFSKSWRPNNSLKSSKRSVECSSLSSESVEMRNEISAAEFDRVCQRNNDMQSRVQYLEQMIDELELRSGRITNSFNLLFLCSSLFVMIVVIGVLIIFQTY